jgi:hypothetical protein
MQRMRFFGMENRIVCRSTEMDLTSGLASRIASAIMQCELSRPLLKSIRS